MPKISFTGYCNKPADEIEACTAYAKSLGLSFVEEAQCINNAPLAIVGGGPSINARVDELRAWRGEIWAINGALPWAVAHGIDAAFFTIDPDTYTHSPSPSFESVSRGGRVFAAPRCPTEMFDYLVAIGAEIRLIGLHAGTTGATVAAKLSAFLGYTEVTLFGVESSYHGTTHAYDEQSIPDLMRVACGACEYLTKPELLLQAQYLAALVRELPGVFRERSGGLLRAIVQAKDIEDYDITAVSRLIHQSLKEESSA